MACWGAFACTSCTKALLFPTRTLSPQTTHRRHVGGRVAKAAVRLADDEGDVVALRPGSGGGWRAEVCLGRRGVAVAV